MSSGIFTITTLSLFIASILLVIQITDVQSSYGDACTQKDTSNCTFPVLKCTPAGRCDCYLGVLRDGPSINDTICDMRILMVPLKSTTVFSTSVVFTWDGSSQESGFNYDLEWIPRDGKMDYAYAEGGKVSGLQPDHHYNFTVISDLTNSYPGGKFFGETFSICTKSMYGGQCSTCGACEDAELSCSEAMDTNSRCLCGSKFFNLTNTGNCTLLNTLKVTNISSTTSPTEIILHWTLNTNLSFVTYNVEWSPSGGDLVSITETGATVSALAPGIIYHFSISSVVPGDDYDNQKSVSLDYVAKTQYPHLSECFVDESQECQNTTECIRAADKSFRCMCGPTDYFSDTAGVCSKLEDLQVTDVSETVTAYTVTFTWTTTIQDYALINYTLEWTPGGGRLDNISSTGALVSGLTSSTLYNFTIFSLLPSNKYYPEKQVSVQISSVITENDLEVTIISQAVSATTVTFTWTGSSLGPVVENNLQWIPNDGQQEFVSSSGGRVTGLQPDNQYSFTVVSKLSGDFPERVFIGPNMTICTASIYGGQCSKCGTCESDQQFCLQALDGVERCLCNFALFNLTETGNCTSLNELVVTNITTMSSTTSVNISWASSLQVSSVSYKIQMDPEVGQVEEFTSTGGQVSALNPGNLYYFTIVSVVSKDSYNIENFISSPALSFWTDALYLGVCAPFTNKECQEMTFCALANDFNYRCMCDEGYYFNSIKGACSSMNDLMVTDVSTTTTATTVSLTWPAKQLPALAKYTLEWVPNVGILDSTGPTGAHVSDLKSSTLYNFSIITILPSDNYYQERRVFIQVSFVKTKPSYNETCDVEVGCQDYQHCLPISGSYRCLCNFMNEYFDDINQRCSPVSDLQVELLSTVTSATTVTFHWAGSGPESGLGYNLQWSPTDGHKDYASFTGGQVSGLQPDSEYSFTIISEFPGDSNFPGKTYYGPNTTICTKSLYGGECVKCGACQDDHQNCVTALDNNTRCLCEESFFNLTETGKCTSLNELIVTNITTDISTTSVNITWVANLQVSSVTYKIQLYPEVGQVDRVTSTGGQVSALSPGTYHFFSVESDLPGNAYENGKHISSTEIGFYTDVTHFGYCDPRTNQECMEMTQCYLAEDGINRCMCNDTLYFNAAGEVCSSLDDLKVTDVSATTTATTILLTWPAKQLPTTASFLLDWTPNEGRMDNISSTGAQVSGLNSATRYNFTIISLLPSDHYYPDKRVSVMVSPVMTKSLFGEQCSANDSCQDDHQNCVRALDNNTRCLCEDSFFNLTEAGNCTSLNELIVTNITFIASTTSVNISWLAGLELTSVTYKIKLDSIVGQVSSITRTGGQVIDLYPGTYYQFSVESDLSGNAYQNGKSVSSPEITCWTDEFYLGDCTPDASQECQDMTKCKQAADGIYRCICDSAFYLNDTMGACSSLDDLKVTDVSTRTTATTVSFTWPAKQLPVTGRFELEWVPSGGRLDNISSTGALVTNLTTGTVYNFAIISVLSADEYYPEKRVSVQIDSVMIKNNYSVSLTTTSVSATAVTFLWEEGSPQSDVDYNFEWTPKDGHADYINHSGGRVSGLQMDSQYNFTIIANFSGDSLYPDNMYIGPNLTICTKSLFGQQCSTCSTCQDDHQNCARISDNNDRCICEDSFFNLTETGNCTSLNELVVTNITVTSSYSSANITWLRNVQVSSEVYKIQLYPKDGHVNQETSTGDQVSGLTPGTYYYLFVDSILPRNAYDNENIISSPEVTFWTDIPYLRICSPWSSKECQDTTICLQAKDNSYHCICDSAFYFNTSLDVCSSLDDLKVTNVSATFTSTTVSLTWPAKQLPATGIFTLAWNPNEGRLDNISSTGAHVVGLTSATLYNFTINSLLPPDEIYPEKTVSVQVSSIMTKPAFNETCYVDIGCQDYQYCLPISGTYKCQCDGVIEYYDNTSDRCLAKPSLNQNCDITIGCQETYICSGNPAVCQCKTANDYFDSFSYQCLPLSSLAVVLMSTTVTTTTVSFSWQQDDPDTGARYDIQWTPHDGYLNYTNSEGGQVYGLHPGTQYNFTIVSILSDGPYEPDKKYFGPNVTLSTRNLPESSEHNQVLSVGASVGIGIGCLVLVIIVVAVGVVIYKRRALASTRLQEFSDQEYIPGENYDEGFDEEHSSSARPSHYGSTSKKPAKNITLENMSPSAQAPQAAGNLEVAEDSFDNRDTKALCENIL